DAGRNRETPAVRRARAAGAFYRCAGGRPGADPGEPRGEADRDESPCRGAGVGGARAAHRTRQLARSAANCPAAAGGRDAAARGNAGPVTGERGAATPVAEPDAAEPCRTCGAPAPRAEGAPAACRP